MKAASLAISDAAASDIVEQADWYEAQSGRSLAERWEKAVTAAILNTVRSPNSGTPCAFKSSELSHVRRISIAGFPKHLIFYRFSEREIFLLRVVHGARDLERLL